MLRPSRAAPAAALALVAAPLTGCASPLDDADGDVPRQDVP